ncbi:MAG: TatD family hydrolase [Opitutus sp.]|nr:TatD family hydrolase [Opitutus sp.]
MQLADAHCHYHDEWLLPHRERVLRDLAAVGTVAAVVNGTNEADWADVKQLCADAASTHRSVRLLPSFGVHPWHAGNRSENWERALLEALDTTPGASIGEIGLDRWMLDRAKPDDPRLHGLRRAPLDEQIAVFRRQLELAAARNLPATIHCLDAWGALLEALQTSARPARGFLLHAYAGSLELVKSFTDLGAYFSFNGYFLDPRRAARLQPVFRAIPRDRLLLETDAPAMPVPKEWATHKLPREAGGSIVNHPANLDATCTGLAAWLGIDRDELAAHTLENFRTLFGAV